MAEVVVGGGNGGSLPLELALESRRELHDRAIYGDRAISATQTAVSLCFDDGVSTDYTSIFPLLKARNIPATFAINSGLVGTGGRMTWAQLKELHQHGMELAHHSPLHGADPTNDAAWIAETITGADTLAAADGTFACLVDSYVQPGTYVGTTYNLTTVPQVGTSTVIGQNLRGRFSASFAYIAGVDGRTFGGDGIWVPTTLRHGIGRSGADLQQGTLATLKTNVARWRGGILLGGTHSALLDTGGGNNTTATFTTLLDFLAAERDAGRVEFFTLGSALGILLAVARRNLVASSFVQDAAGNIYGWKAVGVPVINLADAPSGSNSITLATGNANRATWWGPARRSIIVEWQAKNATPASASISRVVWTTEDSALTVYDNLTFNSGQTNNGVTLAAVGDAYTKFSLTLRPDARATAINLDFQCGGANSVKVADVVVKDA